MQHPSAVYPDYTTTGVKWTLRVCNGGGELKPPGVEPVYLQIRKYLNYISILNLTVLAEYFDTWYPLRTLLYAKLKKTEFILELYLGHRGAGVQGCDCCGFDPHSGEWIINNIIISSLWHKGKKSGVKSFAAIELAMPRQIRRKVENGVS